ncbi:AMP-binding protein [Catellatospora tritici]|uniref:AMP-binding protein n=1 Tax=Catellatospora tritici TaxID=2851566 RepID=UPI001C2D1359|nr:AMP-binding protein [Catellatospora tritici]MBV1856075.1 AMP-binding protein [Catellatospora tritici]
MGEQSFDPATNYAHRALTLFAKYGDAEALVAVDGRRYTYAELHAEVVAMAAALWRHGVRPGAAIGVLARNPAESVFLQLAAHLLGCRTAWIANNAPDRFRRGFLDLAEVDFFVYDAVILPEMGAELAALAQDRPVLCFGPGGVGPDLNADRATELPFDPADVTDEPSSLFQTGGTTGSPKLVHHRHGFFAALHLLSEFYLASGAPQLRHLLVAGTWHVSAQTAVFMTLFSGGTAFLHDGLEYPLFYETVARERINSTLLAPPLLYVLLDDPKSADADFSSLVTLTVSGAAASPARLTQAIARFGPVIRIVYGMSESPFITAMANLDHDPDHPERLASCGVPYGDVRVQIRDEDNQVLPAGAVGEVWVSGSLLMAGYWGMPELTEQTLVDGWLRTGDVGRLDEHGYLYLLDRVKDMIVTGLSSTNVFCRPVEDALAGHPQVRAAAVIGVPHELEGEAVYAYVVPAAGATVTGDELRAHAAAELNAMWAPQQIEFIEAFPLTESGKVDKKALRERYLAGVQEA